MSTWQWFAYVAFVTDTFGDRIVGWRLSASQTTDFVLDALEQALSERDVVVDALIHHSGLGNEDGSVAYTDQLSGSGVIP